MSGKLTEQIKQQQDDNRRLIQDLDDRDAQIERLQRDLRGVQSVQPGGKQSRRGVTEVVGDIPDIFA